jgi:hypothetical protein
MREMTVRGRSQRKVLLAITIAQERKLPRSIDSQG